MERRSFFRRMAGLIAAPLALPFAKDEPVTEANSGTITFENAPPFDAEVRIVLRGVEQLPTPDYTIT